MFEQYSRAIEHIYSPLRRMEQVTGSLPSARSRLVVGARAITFLFRSNLITNRAAQLLTRDLRTELQRSGRQRTFAEVRPEFIGYVATAPPRTKGLTHLIDAAADISEMHRNAVSGAMVRVDEQENDVTQTEVSEPDVKTIANLMDFTIENVIKTEADP